MTIKSITGLRSWPEKTLFIIALVSIVEVFAIRYHFGLPCLDETFARIVDDICVSIVGSYLFFLVNFSLPKWNRQRHQRPLASEKVEAVLDFGIYLIRATLVPMGSQGELSREEMEECFRSKGPERCASLLNMHAMRVSQKCSELLQLYEILNPEIIGILDRIKNRADVSIIGEKQEFDDLFFSSHFQIYQELFDCAKRLERFRSGKELLE